MDRRRLNKIQREIRDERRRVSTHESLKAIATSLKRVKLEGAQARGKEPTFVSTVFKEARPISIPYHGKNAGIAPKTAKNILNDLEADLFRFLERLNEEENDNVQDDSELTH